MATIAAPKSSRVPPVADGGSGQPDGAGAAPTRLLRIHEVASETRLTARSIRYYEEVGLLRPCARSEGDYRLYDASDVERLHTIRSLRDDAGLSLAEIGQVLEDEESRRRARAALQATDDRSERRVIFEERLASLERLHAALRPKLSRLEALVQDVEGRRERVRERLAEVDAMGEVTR